MNIEHNQSCEPMDIDLSVHSSNDMDISFNDSKDGVKHYPRCESVSTPCEEENIENFLKSINESLISTPNTETVGNFSQPQVIKKFRIILQKGNTYNTTKFKIVCSALVIIIVAIAYQVLNIKCSEEINMNILRKSLSNRLFGQTNAINGLMEGLSVNEQNKLIILYGGTGVGKTFATSVLLDHLGLYSNVYHYTMPSFNKFTTDFMVGLTVCKNSIIIVDDLSPNDSQVKLHINSIITKSLNLNKDVTIILIYNIDSERDYTSFTTQIMHNFEEVNAYTKLIRFENLHEEHLRKCIEAELENRKVSDIEFVKIVKNFNVTNDGCKGVHSKMKFWDVS